MPDEHYLKDIAAELKLIRKELQRMNKPLECTLIEPQVRCECLSDLSDRVMNRISLHQHSEPRFGEELTQPLLPK